MGTPANDAERTALAYLRDRLPDDYTLLHNFELHRDRAAFEIDLAILAPHCIYIVDLKGTAGPTTVHGRKWYPSGRAAFLSPLPKLRSHAKTIKSLLEETYPSRLDVGKIYVDAVVVLTAPDAQLLDPDQRDAPDVVRLDHAPAFFTNASRVDANRFSKAIRSLLPLVHQALAGSAQGRLAARAFGNYTVVDQISSADAYTEYRGFNTPVGDARQTVRLRVYRADPYLPTLERAEQRRRIANAYQALMRLPAHPNILGARDFFPGEDEDYYVLVLDDLAGQALRQHIDKPQLALTLGQRLQLAVDLLIGLAHAHQHAVVHRNLHPGALFVGPDNRLRIGDFEYARAGSDRSRTIAGDILDDLEPAYRAPEVANEAAIVVWLRRPLVDIVIRPARQHHEAWRAYSLA
jgi:serine/threonine protein kinase